MSSTLLDGNESYNYDINLKSKFMNDIVRIYLDFARE